MSEDVVPAENEPKDIKASDLFKGVEDEPNEEDVITPTYKVDDTVIDKPAGNYQTSDKLTWSHIRINNDDKKRAIVCIIQKKVVPLQRNWRCKIPNWRCKLTHLAV